MTNEDDEQTQSSDGPGHDAVVHIFDTSDRLGKKIAGWKWSDGRKTLSPDEQDVADRLTQEAEDRVDPSELEHGTVLARVWMDDESVERVEWDDQYVDSESDH